MDQYNQQRRQGVTSQPGRSSWPIVLAIIVAGIIIAGTLLYLKHTPASGVVSHPENNMKPITSADHILGNPNAPIQIVEYSDTDCPYCQQYQTTLHQIITQYGPSGKVAWVYRHFPIHQNSPKEAEAAECAAEQGGNDAFWKYIDLLFSKKDFSQVPYQELDPSQLPILATSIGLIKDTFTNCLNNGTYTAAVAQDYKDAVAAGGLGTPYTIIVAGNTKIPIASGAVSYDNMKTLIDTLINGGNPTTPTQ